MSPDRDHDFLSGPISPAEETLRLVASLPVPDRLVDRVQDRLRSTPQRSRIIEWPLWLGATAFRYSAAMRGAAAAAIVLVVAGGGWSIYSHVQPLPVGPIVAAPARLSGDGFSSAGAMRKPDSPNGAVLTHEIKAKPVHQQVGAPASHLPAARKPAKKHVRAVPGIAQPR